MLRPSNTTPRPPQRRGAILVVVLALLALFAVIGISFVFYADSEANAARIHREGQARSDTTHPDATEAINRALGTLLYDAEPGGMVNNMPGPPGVGSNYNALRGHSLLRAMYGWNAIPGATQTTHTLPYNGVGTFHQSFDLNAFLGFPATTNLVLPDQARWINYTTIPFPNAASVPTGVTVDPEWTGFNGQTFYNGVSPVPQPVTRHYVGKNGPYTYPDLKDFYLASISPATGEVLTKSFHRDWLFNGVFSPNPSNAQGIGGNPNIGFRLAPYDPNDPRFVYNTDWISPEGRTKILRPRPVDQLSQAELGTVFPSRIIPIDIATNPSYAGQRQQLANLINAKIAAGEIMGYPPPNTYDPNDPRILGTGMVPEHYTGDVQNIMGGTGRQRNDSILMDVGMAPIKYNGKYIQPLVAITILDHEGRLNLDSHGNLRGGASGARDHQSFAGIGPFEVNPRRAFDPSMTNAASLVDLQNALRGRYQGYDTALNPPGVNSRAGATQMLFDRSGVQLPAYSPVSYDGSPNSKTTYVSVSMPSFTTTPTPTPFRTVPLYNGTGWDVNGTAQANNHPQLFAPSEWPSQVSPNLRGRLFDPLDFRRLTFRYAPGPEINKTLDVGQYAQTFLRGAPLVTPANAATYRLDASHPMRMLFAPRGVGLDYPAMSPHFLEYAGPSSTNNLKVYPSTAQKFNGPNAFAPPQPSAGRPGNATMYNSAMPDPSDSAVTVTANAGDYGTNGGTPAIRQWRNRRAGVGPVDVNRPLADYRTDPKSAPSPMNPNVSTPAGQAQFYQAWVDRHNLAKDIFARLIVATGARATVDPVTGNITYPFSSAPISTSPDFEAFNGLRYLAQVAVNIVDYVDGDDVITPFIWFSPGADSTLRTVDASYLQSNSTVVLTNAGNFTVFGVEKPRLVINESYSEITNDPEEGGETDLIKLGMKGKYSSANVRFWVELLNPTSAPYANAATGGPLGDGSARLRWESNDLNNLFKGVAPFTRFAVYRLAVVRAGKQALAANGTRYTAQDYLNSGRVTDGVNTAVVGLDNVAGWLPTTPAPMFPEIDYDFVDVNPVNNGVLDASVISPNNGTYDAKGLRGAGMVLVGPKLLTRGDMQVPNKIALEKTVEFNPMNSLGMAGVPPPPWTNTILSNNVVKPQNSPGMAYQAPLPTPTELVNQTRNHIVMLRRLANPHMPANPTIDPVTGNPTFNAALPVNVYVTVDMMNSVPAHDAVWVAKKDGAYNGQTTRDPRPAQPPATPEDPNGYQAFQNRFAVGKVQPYAGYAPPSLQKADGTGDDTATYDPLAYSKPAYVPKWDQFTTAVPAPTQPGDPSGYLGMNRFSAVIQQDPVPPPRGPSAGDYVPRLTMGRHNGRTPIGPPGPNSTLVPAAVPPELSDTIAAPFDWYVHMDRQLANPLELRWVQACKPHMVTQMFWQPATANTNAPNKEAGLVPWHLPGSAPGQPPDPTIANVAPYNYNQTGHGMFRALELLRIKPYTFGAGVGGKLHGRININTVQDYRVLLALLDPPVDMSSGGNGNLFDMYDVFRNNAATELWNRVIASRTGTMSQRYQPDGTPLPVPVPGPTYDDVGYAGTAPYLAYPAATTQVDPRTGQWMGMQVFGPQLDRPMKSFGSVDYKGTPGSSTSTGWYAGGGSTFQEPSPPAPTPFFAFGPGLKDTLLRTFPDPADATGVTQVPRLWVDRFSQNPAVGSASASPIDRGHQYFRSEAARKLFNNVTTTSNTFTVMMTVVFHEVRTDPIQTWIILTEPVTGRPLLGKELYRDVPGDLRQQYFALVDRTNATMTKQLFVTYVGGTVTSSVPFVDTRPGPRPFFTTLESAPVNPPPGSQFGTIQVAAVMDKDSGNQLCVIADGVPVPIKVRPPVGATKFDNILYLGTGAETEAVVVDSLVSFSTAGGNPVGVATLSVAPLDSSGNAQPRFAKTHAAGSVASNVMVGTQDASSVPVAPIQPFVPPLGPPPKDGTYTLEGYTIGNVGPQGGFQYWNPQYQPVLPVVVRLR